jgi:MSHA pilin protein MshA
MTLVELVAVLLVLVVLSALALPKLRDLGTDARIAAVNALAASVHSATQKVKLALDAKGLSTSASAHTFLQTDGQAYVRIWKGYPDRWWDGIGITQVAANTTISNYGSAAPVVYDQFTFYGFGGPLGNAGWVVTHAPTPTQCSVQYVFDGSGEPAIVVTTRGC